MKNNLNFKEGDVVVRIENHYAGMKIGDIDIITEVQNTGLVLKKYHRNIGRLNPAIHSFTSFKLAGELETIIHKIKEEINYV